MLPERALIHSNAAWLGSGYGQQTRILCRIFGKLGIKVAVSAFCGLLGARTVWEGIPHFPQGFNEYGNDVVEGHAQEWEADLVLTVMDCFGLHAEIMKRLGAVHWMPVDTPHLGARDRFALETSGCTPIAFAKFGRDVLSQAGFAPYYIPHGIETGVFKPGDGAAVRERMGIGPDTFVVLMNAANADNRDRKAFARQFAAFAVFHQAHPDSLLVLHTLLPGPGLDLDAVVARLSIREAIRCSSRQKYTTGGFTPADMAKWYLAAAGNGVYLGASKAEGFGLPLLEAQSCGIPVIATDGSAMTENCSAGWLVSGDVEWHDGHLSWWVSPRVDEIVEALEAAYQTRGDQAMADKARSFALGFDYETLIPEWQRVLTLIMQAKSA